MQTKVEETKMHNVEKIVFVYQLTSNTDLDLSSHVLCVKEKESSIINQI